MASPKRSKKTVKKSLNFPYTNFFLSLLFILIGAAILIWPSLLKAGPLFLENSKAQESNPIIEAKYIFQMVISQVTAGQLPKPAFLSTPNLLFPVQRVIAFYTATIPKKS